MKPTIVSALLASLAIATALDGALTAPPAMAAPTAIYWTDRDGATVNKNVAGVNTILVPSTGGRLQDVDLDPTTGTLYFSDWGPVGPPGGEGSIDKVNTDGTGLATVLSTGDAVHQLALDQANNRIFFTRAVSYDGREISVVNTDGTGYTFLYLPDWFPSGLALDSANSKLYWGDIGVLNFGTPRGAVNVVNTNGTAPMELEPHVNGRGRGFALHNGIIYLTAHDPINPGLGGGIFTYDIANDVLTQIITDPTTGFWDIEVDPFDQRIYFTNYGAGTIESANFDGTGRVTVLSGLGHPYGLALELRARPTPGKVTGGGQIEDPVFSPTGDLLSLPAITVSLSGGGAQANFGFVVNDGPSPKGNLVYNDHGAAVRIKATSFTGLTIGSPGATCPLTPGSKHARFTGTADVNGVSESFTVEVDDCAEPGSSPGAGPDHFSIDTDSYGPNSGPLIRGNIQIHK